LLLKLATDQAVTQANEIALRLTREFPENARYATLLGAAHYRAGDCDEAIRILTGLDPRRVMENSSHEFWLAMAYAERDQGDDRQRAAAAYEKGLERMQRNAPGGVTLSQLRDEAATLLGIEVPTEPANSTQH
jgi:predicted Zn-dependent protease